MSKVKGGNAGTKVEYGMVANAGQIERFLDINMEMSNRLRETGAPGRVPFIWGEKGIGKTESVRAWAQKNGYEMVEVPLAQFEEMGDINGFPQIAHVEDPHGNVKEKTINVAPDWVPDHVPEKGGILFFDDANRAESRIQRGLMQLYQTYGMVSWKIPKGWMIVATGNPEDGEYDVSSMDEAQVTRLNHIRMKFDSKSWAKWAESANIHPEGIKFVLRYPEMAEPNGRTCPRTLVEFFRSLQYIGQTGEELKKNLNEVMMMGQASLEEETVSTFVTFLNQDSDLVLSPEYILTKPKETAEHIKKVNSSKKGVRADLMNVMATRLMNHILASEFKLDKKKGEAILNFWRTCFDKDGKGLPKEQVVMMITEINKAKTNADNLIKLWSSDDKLVQMISESS